MRQSDQAFCYPLVNTIYARKVLAMYNLHSPDQLDLPGRLEIFGALLAAGEPTAYAGLLKNSDFSNFSSEDRQEAVLHIFRTILLTVGGMQGLSPGFGRALLSLFNVLSPETAILPSVVKSSPPQPLIQLEYARSIHPGVTGTIFSRGSFYGPGSRKHELGFRIQQGFVSQGWDVALRPCTDLKSFSSAAVQDFAMVDVALLAETQDESVFDLLATLKKSFRKTIAIVPDPWVPLYIKTLELLSGYLDYVWGFSSDWALTGSPAFKDKMVLFPGPSGFDDISSNIKPCSLDQPSFGFTGSIEMFNINRIFWVLESISRGLPIQYNITDPAKDDGLEEKASLEIYAQKLSSTDVALNFTTRRDGSNVVIPGRAIEVISLGRLLLQESCPVFHVYFTEGEHFCEFADMAGLQQTIERLGSKPQLARKIAEAGLQFYQERYSRRKMVQHFQGLL